MVFLGESGGWSDSNTNGRQSLVCRFANRLQRHLEAADVDISLLTKAQGIKARTGADGGEKEIEGSRRRTAAAADLFRLIRMNDSASEMGIDGQPARKGHLHEQDTSLLDAQCWLRVIAPRAIWGFDRLRRSRHLFELGVCGHGGDGQEPV